MTARKARGSASTVLPITVWSPDTARCERDARYLDNVRTFVLAHVPRGDLTDARILEDADGALTFGTTSWWIDGVTDRDYAGRPTVGTWISVPLKPELAIP